MNFGTLLLVSAFSITYACFLSFLSSLDCCKFDCRELFRTDCNISKVITLFSLTSPSLMFTLLFGFRSVVNDDVFLSFIFPLHALHLGKSYAIECRSYKVECDLAPECFGKKIVYSCAVFMS